MYIQLCNKIHNYFFKEKTGNRCVVEMLRAAVDQESEGASQKSTDISNSIESTGCFIVN